MPIPGGLEPPSADQAPATVRYTARRLPFPLRLSISSTSPEIFEAPPRSHRDDRCFQHTRSRVDSKHTDRLPLCAEGPRCTLGLLSRRSVRVSHIEIKTRVFPRRHRSIPPLEGFACRPVPLYHPTDGAFRTPSIVPTRQHPPSLRLANISTVISNLPHLHRNGRPGGARTRTHPATSGSTVVPTYSDSHGAERYNSATCRLRSTSSGSFRGEKCL